MFAAIWCLDYLLSHHYMKDIRTQEWWNFSKPGSRLFLYKIPPRTLCSIQMKPEVAQQKMEQGMFSGFRSGICLSVSVLPETTWKCEMHSKTIKASKGETNISFHFKYSGHFNESSLACSFSYFTENCSRLKVVNESVTLGISERVETPDCY